MSDFANGKFKISANSPRIEFYESDESKTYFLIGSGGNFSLVQDTTSTTPYPLHFISSTGILTTMGHEIWHAGNDGAGTGLNADLLDGNHASVFLRSDGDDDFSGFNPVSNLYSLLKMIWKSYDCY